MTETGGVFSISMVHSFSSHSQTAHPRREPERKTSWWHTVSFPLLSGPSLIRWSSMPLEPKKCVTVTCGEEFIPRNKNQTHCPKHAQRKGFNKGRVCLWCSRHLTCTLKDNSPFETRFCNADCMIRFKIYGKSRIEIMKELNINLENGEKVAWLQLFRVQRCFPEILFQHQTESETLRDVYRAFSTMCGLSFMEKIVFWRARK